MALGFGGTKVKEGGVISVWKFKGEEMGAEYNMLEMCRIRHEYKEKEHFFPTHSLTQHSSNIYWVLMRH